MNDEAKPNPIRAAQAEHARLLTSSVSIATASVEEAKDGGR